jgi:response regulator RpfG family c-di-GMP phosphodiesterase
VREDPMETSPSPLPEPTLLFVDDEPSILSSLRRLCRPQGYRVLVAESGAAALEILEREPVDLIVSDMRMPQMDGAQLLAIVRERWPEVVRLLLTGYADISSTIAAINHGEIHRYIAKPWDDQELLLSLSDSLKRLQLERENRRYAALVQQQNEQLQQANEKLQQLNAELEASNARLASSNEELDRRVQERTAELEQSNAKLADANARMAAANQKLQEANALLEENFATSISVFSALLELRDGSVSGHGHRVAALAQRIAEQMDMGPAEVLDIYNAGLLHEIGKIGLPDALMNKTVSLMSGAEFERFKRHPVQAQAALMPLGRLRQTALIIRSQHERVDGHGFPDGLSGYEVPLGSQIVNLASTFESLIAGRLAEKVYSTQEAASLIADGAAQRYAPDLWKAFNAVLRELIKEAAADVEVDSSGLRSGMVLSRALLSPQGSVLLPAGFKFTAQLVRQVQELEARDGLKLSYFVKQDKDARASAAGPARTSPPAARQPEPAQPTPAVQHA